MGSSDVAKKKKYQMAVRSFDLYSTVELLDWVTQWHDTGVCTTSGSGERHRAQQSKEVWEWIRDEEEKRRRRTALASSNNASRAT